MHPNTDRWASLRSDLLLIVFLIALDATARLLPHPPNFTPVAASALFAGAMLRHRALAFAVPVGAMLLSDLVIGFDRVGVTAVVYASLAMPAVAGILVRRLPTRLALLPAVLSCSLLFYATTNFAVWAFSGMYSPDLAGLIKCYIAALPFLQYTVAGDVCWSVALFGGAFAVQQLAWANRRVVTVRVSRRA